jgi:hypothetical protein
LIESRHADTVHQLLPRAGRGLQRAEHRQTFGAADALRSGEHALIHAARQSSGFAAALAEIAQSLDYRHLQISTTTVGWKSRRRAGTRPAR